ncbi:hypothetical protein [Mangrovibrevibacter kandeliae]|uniref:hypothetical protein n=1 Tax=Mangrovibrevibacter kandeliae TaxID=2968473 RepID=UPI0021193FA5|nr:hypothetical protein [Aurantimonas sp. CSK15Z-1]MCQ8782756.1 hypothetical protein [Aurantimonas sp. CSK15Z-1]
MRRLPLVGLALCLAGCAPDLPVAAAPRVSTAAPPADTGGKPAAATDVPPDRPTPTEAAYARDTARLLYGRAPSERSATFVVAGPDEWSLCLRAPGKRPALIVFARRFRSEAISQVEDDVEIRRRATDTGACRKAGMAWISVS